MSGPSTIRLFVENRAEELAVAGIFADYVRDNRINVRMCWTSSGAISFAETYLLQAPTSPVALVLNCKADPEEFRMPIDRILSRTAGKDLWHVALAIPDVTAWLLKAPLFAASWKAETAKGRPSGNAEIVVHFSDWIQKPGNRFERAVVGQADDEFAALNQFVEQHVSALADA